MQILQSVAAAPPLRRDALPRAAVAGLYVHVPFCIHKCGYCDFYSIARQSRERMEKFVDLVLREAEGWAGADGSVACRPVTVFFGGGTPSLLPLEPMRRMLAGLKSIFDFSQCTEWTIEANPATVTAEYCQMLREAGVDRLSMGAQSFDSRELAILERNHQPEDVRRSLALARAAGFERVNIDLIFAVPGQTMEKWGQSLETALGLGTDHLSCYALTYEPNTPMAVRKRLGQFVGAEQELELEMLMWTRRRLADAGMRAYEISNFAKPGEECRHNLMYWNGGNYLGLGPAAASHVSGWRWRNRPHLGEWERAVESGEIPAIEVETLSPKQRAGELAMLQLRLDRGLEDSTFAALTGYDAHELFAPAIERMRRAGLIIVEKASIRLSESGLAVADGVAAEFLAAAGR